MPRLVTKIALLVLIARIVLAQAVSAPASADLHMSARIVSHYVGLTDVEVTLTNTSDHAMAVGLGYVMNGRDHPARGMKFVLTDAGGGVHEVGYRDGFMEGKIEPSVIEMPAHGEYVFDIPTDRMPLRNNFELDVARFLGTGARLSLSTIPLQPGFIRDATRQSKLPLWTGTAATTVKLELPPNSAPTQFQAPRNRDEALTLLERYWLRWRDLQASAARQQLIAWFIKNVDYTCVPDTQYIFVNPDDKTGYAALRQLWLEQVAAHPRDYCVIENAGVALSLTDRETAANWLKQDSRNCHHLANLYANALAGVTGMTPMNGATSFDLRVANSDFAKAAAQEIMNDAGLAGDVGWMLNLTTNYVRHEKLGNYDFDALAEKFLLREAELDYPDPTPIAHLRQLYGSQERKPAASQIRNKAEVTALSPTELASRQVQKRSTQVDGLDHTVTITVDVIVGIDGHVWKATARNPPTEELGRFAESRMIDGPFRPMRVNGVPVQMSGTTEVTLIAPSDRTAFEALH